MNHYTWLDSHFPEFLKKLGIDFNTKCPGIISAHGDKCNGYFSRWESAGIPFPHGVALYLLTYLRPYEDEVRETDKGWVDPCKWVIENYSRFKELLPVVRVVVVHGLRWYEVETGVFENELCQRLGEGDIGVLKDQETMERARAMSRR